MSKKANSTNQEIEKRCFERFKKCYPLPEGGITFSDKPDVILNGERKLGIEITLFYREEGSSPSSEQRQIALREEVLKSAQENYLKNGGRKIDIWFGFHKEIGNKQRLINDLVLLAQRIDSRTSDEVSRREFSHIPELSWVYLNGNEYHNPRWTTLQVYTSQSMSRDRLLKIIGDKERKAQNYTKCDAYWLLVVVDPFNMASDVEILNDEFGKYSSDFEKVIVFRASANEVLEL